MDANLGPAPVISVSGLSKSYPGRQRNDLLAVDDLSFDVGPGITGFLGPNGAGKTTTLRMLLGLAQPDAGTATIGGRAYRDLTNPTRTVGAVIDSAAFEPGATARNHLRIHATIAGIGDRRVREVIELLGVAGFADRRTHGFSTGMKQRLGLATALLGDPEVLILDEPTNGLDPQGIAWLRHLLRRLAAEGRTVLISSHVLSEVEQVIDRALVLRGGRLVAAGTLAELRRPGEHLEDLFLRLTDTTELTGAMS